MKQDMWYRHRYDNAVQVIEALWNESPLSRAEIGRRVHLDRSTVGTIVDHLVEIGLVAETSDSLGQPVGRPARALKLRSDYGYALGISYTPEMVETIAVDTSGKIFERFNSLPATENIGANVVQAIESAIAGVEISGEDTSVNKARLLSVGIAIPGVVDTQQGDVLVSRSLGIHQTLKLGSSIATQVSVPVSVFNDADAGALGEYDSHVGVEDLLYVLIRYSEHPFRANAGLGIILDHRLREAHSGLGREFRSPYVSPDSVEQFRVSELVREDSAFTNGELRMHFADELGASLAFLIHALDLRNIVLAGDVEGGVLDRSDLEERILHYVRTSTVQVSNQTLRIDRSRIGEHSIQFGAAVGSIRRMFQHKNFPVGPQVSRHVRASIEGKMSHSIP